MSTYDYADASKWRGTTILSVRKIGKIVVVGDGQVSAGNTVMKSTAKKVRTLAGGNVITGFAGATADAFALLERLEAKLIRFYNITISSKYISVIFIRDYHHGL